ncbi:MAG: putative bifunctional diguanylate cyclase/phosphodiesterase, partial [Thermoleophilaceae bacterium]
LAVLLGKSVSSTAGEQARLQAQRHADLAARGLGKRRLARAAAQRRPSRATRGRVSRSLSRLTSKDGVMVIRVLNSRGHVSFSSRARERGGSLSAQGLTQALGGRPSTEKAMRRGREAIDAFVPLRRAVGRRPSAVLQAEMTAEPSASSGAGDTRRLYLILIAGLAVLCAGLLRTMTGASARMRDRAAAHEQQALRDPLTGLPNRELFNRMIDRALADCPRDGMAAVLLMDLDRFKEINDSLGHFNGDLVIERVGKRLRTTLREGDVVARLGGDEFAMLLPSIQAKDSVTGAAQRIHDALEEPFTVGGLALRVEASIGAALYPGDGDTAGKLLQAADVAMYAAKKAHSGHEFYSPDQHRYTPARLGLVAQLDRAMDKHELVLHYQPKARLATGTVEGVEALARWNHPTRGLLFPDEFIPVTEHTSMIRPVTVHLLETALEQVQEWSGRGLRLDVAVNLSAQLLLDLQLPHEIGRMLSRIGAPPHLLEVEVTESAIMSDPRRARRVLESMREMGVRVAIDDFGTGYSSLVSLKQMPVSTIKVDKSFVMNMENDADDAAIVRSTIGLGHNLGLQVVAEGVESHRAWEQLADMGADIAQGYYLSKPLAPAQFDVWLAAYQDMFGRGAEGGRTGAGEEAGGQPWRALAG